MTERSPFDRLLRAADGEHGEWWDSDTEEGRRRIAEREAAATSNDVLAQLSGHLDDLFAGERKYQRARLSADSKRIADTLANATAGVIARERKRQRQQTDDNTAAATSIAARLTQVEADLAALTGRVDALAESVAALLPPVPLSAPRPKLREAS